MPTQTIIMYDEARLYTKSGSLCPLTVPILFSLQVPNRPGQAFILQGGHNYSPGIFPQLIFPLNESETVGEVYIMNTGERVGNLTDWKRILVAGNSPGRREGASTAVDTSGGVVYLFGGRTTEK